MLLVCLDRDARAVVPDADQVLLLVNLDLDHAHLVVPLKIVRRIHQDFVCKQSGTEAKSELSAD